MTRKITHSDLSTIKERAIRAHNDLSTPSGRSDLSIPKSYFVAVVEFLVSNGLMENHNLDLGDERVNDDWIIDE